jgi:hypothetical protein
MLYLSGFVFLIAYLHMRRSPSHSRGGGRWHLRFARAHSLNCLFVNSIAIIITISTTCVI